MRNARISQNRAEYKIAGTNRKSSVCRPRSLDYSINFNALITVIEYSILFRYWSERYYFALLKLIGIITVSLCPIIILCRASNP